MANEHIFRGALTWDPSAGTTGAGLTGYGRNWVFRQDGKPELQGSAAGAYRGDESIPNPEDLLVASVAACHMLTFLAVASRACIDITSYEDQPEATMTIRDGKMRIVEVRLSPKLGGGEFDPAQIAELHHKAHEGCFIANSINFPVTVTPR